MSTVERLLNGYWHLVAHRSELPRPKDFLRLGWGGGDLVVYNDQGEIIAFDNLCPHRGARMFTGDAGNAPASCLYHGWTYRNGALRLPPQHQCLLSEPNPPRLNRFQIAWCGDFLFVSPTPEHRLDQQLGALAQRLEGVSADIEGRWDFNAYVFECDWRVAIENALEADHVDLIHPESLALLKLAPGDFVFEGAHSIWSTEVTEARALRSLSAIRRYFNVPHAYPGYTNIFVFPFAMLSSTFGYSYALQVFAPGANAGRTHFSSRLLAGRAASDAARPMVESLMASTTELNRRVFDEDHQICRRISPSYRLDDPERYFGPMEARLRHFQTQLSQITKS